ncbi:MAG TPA: efflux transporter outer membrane subunit [Candidatus Binatia bacterium]|jgi:multidrug efflux system outer membrane protein|nr:efflux transporter outer membrane subunit [Candidatus Binatia bacterium]
MKKLLFVLSCVCHFGCAIGPNYLRPELPLPETHRGQVGVPEATSLADLPWWEVFQDKVLKGLIEEALANNYDLRTAAARVEQARALAGVARAEFFPQIGYEGDAGRAHGISQARVPVLSGQTSNTFSGVFSLAWELDVWGRIRRANEAAFAELFASEEFRRGIVLTLVSDVAQAYFELRELDLELEIAQRTIASFQRTLDLFTRRLQLGVASKLETARAEAALAGTAATIPNLERRIVAKENQISVLLGRNPSPIPRGTLLVDQTVPPVTPAGLPSQLLERRPDILQAEQTLVAANARVGVAEANFFPRVGLTSLYGGASADVENVVKGSGNIWSVAGQLAGPILQGGQIFENYQAALAQWEQAKLQYEQTVIRAFQEVSNALTDQQKLAEVREEQTRAVTALRESVRLSTLRYTGGFANYFEVIEAQQQLFPAENTLAQVQRDQLIAVVELYRALGGGWSAYAAPPTPPPLWHVVLP